MLVGIAALVLALSILRAAWLCDDAYITFRTADNWVHGYGLRWNVAERVQSFTHPLWLFAFSALYAPSGSVLFAAWFLAGLCLAGIIWSLRRAFAEQPLALVPVLCALSVSAPFVDFSTSGLENPLTHLGIALLAWQTLDEHGDAHRRLRNVSLIVGLMAVNRLDTVLLGAPLLLWLLWKTRSWDTLRSVLARALLPIACWLVFAIVYYGSPFPNTAYAKLGAGIPRIELIQQGLLYLLETALRDPLSALLLLTGMAVIRTLPQERTALSLGGILYVAYIVWIGGDFMLGRFLTGPILISCICVATTLARLPRRRLRPVAHTAIALSVALMGWSEVTQVATWLKNSTPEPTPASTMSSLPFSIRGISDERDFYQHGTSIARVARQRELPDWEWFTAGRQARRDAREGRKPNPQGGYFPYPVVFAVIGFYGFGAGPDVHVIDPRGISDPFLARLPAQYVPDWRIGHFNRFVPPGYVQSAQEGQCRLANRTLCPALERVFRVTRGPLWTWRRFSDIAALAVGSFLTDEQEDRLRHPKIRHAKASDLGKRLPEGFPWNPHFAFPADGIQVDLKGTSHTRGWTLGLDHNDAYDILVRRGDRVVATFREKPDLGGGIIGHHIDIPEDVARGGYNNIRVLPRGTDTRFGLAYLVADR